MLPNADMTRHIPLPLFPEESTMEEETRQDEEASEAEAELEPPRRRQRTEYWFKIAPAKKRAVVFFVDFLAE